MLTAHLALLLKELPVGSLQKAKKRQVKKNHNKSFFVRVAYAPSDSYCLNPVRLLPTLVPKYSTKRLPPHSWHLIVCRAWKFGTIKSADPLVNQYENRMSDIMCNKAVNVLRPKCAGLFEPFLKCIGWRLPG